MLVHICQSLAFPLVDLTAVGAAKKRGLEAEDGSEKRQKFASGEDEIHLSPYMLLTTELSSRTRYFDWALTPSSAATMPRFQNEQERRPVFNGRPLYNSGPPFGLFHPVFNSFNAAMRDPERSYVNATMYSLVKALFRPPIFMSQRANG